jgi:hypothetical protein
MGTQPRRRVSDHGVLLCATLTTLLFLVATLAAPLAASAASRQPGDYWFVDKWGGPGSADGLFGDPEGVDVAPDGTVFVYDSGNFRVQWFAADGTFLGKFGTNGDAYGAFKYAYDLAVDPIGAWLYVGDRDLARAEIERFAIGPAPGHALSLDPAHPGWTFGNGTGSEFDPTGIDVAANGDVYVTEEKFNRVTQFTADGAFVRSWGGAGSGNGQFSGPQGIAVVRSGANAGRVYVADTGNRRVQYFDPPFNAPTYGYAGQWTVDATHGPAAIDVGPDGLVYVCGLFSPRCRQYTASGGAPPNTSGTPAGAWASTESTDGRIVRPWGIAVGPNDTIYVSDADPDASNLDRVQAFRRDKDAPVTTDNVPDGAADTAAGWITQLPFTPTLTRTDDLAGIAITRWRLHSYNPDEWDGTNGPAGLDGCAPPTSPASPAALPPEATLVHDGVVLLEYYSEDNASRTEVTKSVWVRIDTTPPLTDDDRDGRGGWNGSPLTVNFTVDNGVVGQVSGVAATQYRFNGGAWHTGTAALVDIEGRVTIDYRSLDIAGNVESPKQCVVMMDLTAPATTDDAPPGWSRRPVTVTLAASDAKAGVAETAGVWQTNLRLDGPGGAGTWVVGGSQTVTGDGDHTLWYYSTDQAGNAETPKSCHIRIDTGAPVPSAVRNATVKRGKTATLRYRVADALSPTCWVTIKILNARGKVVKTFKLGGRSAGSGLAKSFRCTLPKGRYSWRVYATDLAGNTQAKPGIRTLTVQ